MLAVGAGVLDGAGAGVGAFGANAWKLAELKAFSTTVSDLGELPIKIGCPSSFWNMHFLLWLVDTACSGLMSNGYHICEADAICSFCRRLAAKCWRCLALVMQGKLGGGSKHLFVL